jgi:hypothetical protein
MLLVEINVDIVIIPTLSLCRRVATVPSFHLCLWLPNWCRRWMVGAELLLLLRTTAMGNPWSCHQQ